MAQVIDNYENALRVPFLGSNWDYQAQIEKEKERSRYMNLLTNLQFCDMCQIDTYICLFQRYYYKLYQQSDPERKMLLSLFYQKSLNLGEKIRNKVSYMDTTTTRYIRSSNIIPKNQIRSMGGKTQ